MDIISLYKNSHHYKNTEPENLIMLMIETSLITSINCSVNFSDFIDFLISEDMTHFNKYIIHVPTVLINNGQEIKKGLYKIYKVMKAVEMRYYNMFFVMDNIPNIIFIINSNKDMQQHLYLFGDMYKKIENKSIRIQQLSFEPQIYSINSLAHFQYGNNDNNNSVEINFLEIDANILSPLGKSVSSLRIGSNVNKNIRNVVLPNLFSLTATLSAKSDVESLMSFIKANPNIKCLHIRPECSWKATDEFVNELCENNTLLKFSAGSGIDELQVAKILALNKSLISFKVLDNFKKPIPITHINENFKRVRLQVQLTKLLLDNIIQFSQTRMILSGCSENDELLSSYLEKYPNNFILHKIVNKCIETYSHNLFKKSHLLLKRVLTKNKNLIDFV